MKRREVLLGAVAMMLGPWSCASRRELRTEGGRWPGAYGNGVFPATFAAGDLGAWKIERIVAARGEGLALAERLRVAEGLGETSEAAWSLRGVASHARYVRRAEKGPLDERSPKLSRPEASRAALIPIRKSAAWWALPQDERRAIFEERSGHIARSMEFLPRVARRLYHSRDLGGPFDFLTWFEFEAAHEPAFDTLLSTLRAQEEWTFVEREVEVRLSRS